jgi:hypothetical protein
MKTIREIFGLSGVPGEIGIEIEMEGRRLMPPNEGDASRYWRYTEDNSLRGQSLEYVLTSPVTRDEAPVALKSLSKLFRDNGCKLEPSDRCGVHIHVNCQELTFKQVINFACLYFVFEDMLVKWCGEDREGNLFCLRAKDAEYIVTFLTRVITTNSFRYMKEQDIRYASINFYALAKYGSLEFRAMRTPKDLALIDTWMNMLLAVKDASLAYSETYEIVEGVSANDAQQFTKMVFKDYAELLECDEQDDMIMEGVRRIQDLAYLPRILAAKKSASRKSAKAAAMYDIESYQHPPGSAQWMVQQAAAMNAALAPTSQPQTVSNYVNWASLNIDPSPSNWPTFEEEEQP